MLAPIAVIVYNRPEHTRQTLEALSQNTLAKDSELFIFCDGPKPGSSPEALAKVEETRRICHEKQWCGKVNVIERQENVGLAANITGGFGELVNKYGKAIELDDDIVTGKYFLEYMNEALDRYENEKKVFHICAWRDPIWTTKKDSSYFHPVVDPWGFATWKDRWQYYKKDPQECLRTFTPEMIYHFNIDGTDTKQFGIIESNANGKMNTWCAFWYATVFTRGGLCLAPTKSLVKNVGLDGTGVHCGKSRWETITDTVDYKITKFPEIIEINKKEYRRDKIHVWCMNFHPLYIIKCMFPMSFKNKIKRLLGRPVNVE